MFQALCKILLTALLATVLVASAAAQSPESSGEAEVALQGYYFGTNSQTVTDTTGAAVSLQQFVPDVGILSLNLQDYGSRNGFQSGENTVRLKDYSLLGRHWDFSGGDLRVQSRRIDTTFSNIFTPEITFRGASIDIKRNDTAMGFFLGAETLQEGPRLPLRVRAPQNVIGATLDQRLDRLQLAFRVVRFSATGDSDLSDAFLQQRQFNSVNTIAGQALYSITKNFKFYAESSLATNRVNLDGTQVKSSPLSWTVGPAWETERVTLRANYVRQTSGFLPVAGYYGGDREGPFVEARYRLTSRIDLYGSANRYTNNLDNSATQDRFRSSNWSVGASANLPSRFNANGQLSFLRLTTTPASTQFTDTSRNRLLNVSLNRPLGRHNLRVALLDLNLNSAIQKQQQRSTEVEDTVTWKHFIVGGAVRFQNESSTENRSSVFFRAMGQVNFNRLTAYANLEKGNDLVNRSVFTTNSFSSTNFGVGAPLFHGWRLQADAFRNQLITNLNPENIFLLGNQGVGVPTRLGGLNQWSAYFRISKHFNWGAPVSIGGLDKYALDHNPLVGVVEGFVYEELLDGQRPAAGIPVTVDGLRSSLTDANGHYRITDVPQGARTVALNDRELPADFEPATHGSLKATVTPRGVTRVELSVRPLTHLSGQITAPPDIPLENILIRLLPSDRYTTPDSDGTFNFYNLREGDYELAVDDATLPEGTYLSSGQRIALQVRIAKDLPSIEFLLNNKTVEKPIQRTFQQRIELTPSTHKPQQGGTHKGTRGPAKSKTRSRKP
jgi:hypothetical protein